MVDSRDKRDCCGCSSCVQACPKDAIKMIEDNHGFRYPQIDYALCINCGICDKACGFNDEYKNNGDNPKVYAARNKDEKVRKTSTSGGMFTALSNYIIQNGGVVYGAAFDDKLNVTHKRAVTYKERDFFKGSKYVCSDINTTYAQAKKDLDTGMYVLFTGTPCQISGLKAFLGREYDKLYTVDLVCHGAPNNKLWREFIDILSKRAKDKLVSAEFRNKEESWLIPKSKMYYKKRTKAVYGEISFFKLFLLDIMHRESCFNCKFTNFARVGDITIGDFWGIDKTMPEINDDKGISLVLVNTEKGNRLIETIKDSVCLWESSKDACVQPQLVAPAEKNLRYEEFWNDYERRGMKYVLTKYGHYSRVETFFFKVKRRLKIMLKR